MTYRKWEFFTLKKKTLGKDKLKLQFDPTQIESSVEYRSGMHRNGENMTPENLTGQETGFLSLQIEVFPNTSIFIHNFGLLR